MSKPKTKVNDKRRPKILDIRPWQKATGPTTKAGKTKSARNALKKGKRIRETTAIRKQRKTIRALEKEIQQLQTFRLEAIDALIEIHELAFESMQ